MAVKEAAPGGRKLRSAPQPPPPPEHLSKELAEIWCEVVSANGLTAGVDATLLETYCRLIAQHRAAAKAVAEDGLVVAGGGAKGAIVHPALAAQRQLADQIRAWAPLFKRPQVAKRRRGPMYDATKMSIAAVPALQTDVHAGPVAAVLTLAWLIDEAQREGVDALQKASFVLIPVYVKTCTALQITPASLPAAPSGKAVTGGSKVSKFQATAKERRGLQAV